ncbi:unnamed protein product [Pleuronectes platessa]|uniref:Uncharacterized protein n=1 Tax=Pleuronectes platessa TaxID=8262 RepID=A0A9N7TNJ1_PLEPL|nr:unnamed protein product [Pleuronectes platessa]
MDDSGVPTGSTPLPDVPERNIRTQFSIVHIRKHLYNQGIMFVKVLHPVTLFHQGLITSVLKVHKDKVATQNLEDEDPRHPSREELLEGLEALDDILLQPERHPRERERERESEKGRVHDATGPSSFSCIVIEA